MLILINNGELVKILGLLNVKFINVNPVSVNSKISRLCDQKKKLASKKKVKGFKNLTDLLNRQFEPPLSNVCVSDVSIPKSPDESVLAVDECLSQVQPVW